MLSTEHRKCLSDGLWLQICKYQSSSKCLSDGLWLQICEYQLSNGGADALERPRKSYERYLILAYPTGGKILQTHPNSSWGLSRDQFLEIYDAISNSSQFIRARHFLDNGGMANLESQAVELTDIIHQFPEGYVHSILYDLAVGMVMRAKQEVGLPLE